MITILSQPFYPKIPSLCSKSDKKDLLGINNPINKQPLNSLIRLNAKGLVMIDAKNRLCNCLHQKFFPEKQATKDMLINQKLLKSITNSQMNQGKHPSRGLTETPNACFSLPSPKEQSIFIFIKGTLITLLSRPLKKATPQSLRWTWVTGLISTRRNFKSLSLLLLVRILKRSCKSVVVST